MLERPINVVFPYDSDFCMIGYLTIDWREIVNLAKFLRGSLKKTLHVKRKSSIFGGGLRGLGVNG